MKKTKYVPHQPTRIKQMPWQYCRRCGLVYLKNEPTRKSIKRGCEE